MTLCVAAEGESVDDMMSEIDRLNEEATAILQASDHLVNPSIDDLDSVELCPAVSESTSFLPLRQASLKDPTLLSEDNSGSAPRNIFNYARWTLESDCAAYRARNRPTSTNMLCSATGFDVRGKTVELSMQDVPRLLGSVGGSNGQSDINNSSAVSTGSIFAATSDSCYSTLSLTSGSYTPRSPGSSFVDSDGSSRCSSTTNFLSKSVGPQTIDLSVSPECGNNNFFTEMPLPFEESLSLPLNCERYSCETADTNISPVSNDENDDGHMDRSCNSQFPSTTGEMISSLTEHMSQSDLVCGNYFKATTGETIYEGISSSDDESWSLPVSYSQHPTCPSPLDVLSHVTSFSPSRFDKPLLGISRHIMQRPMVVLLRLSEDDIAQYESVPHPVATATIEEKPRSISELDLDEKLVGFLTKRNARSKQMAKSKSWKTNKRSLRTTCNAKRKCKISTSHEKQVDTSGHETHVNNGSCEKSSFAVIVPSSDEKQCRIQFSDNEPIGVSMSPSSVDSGKITQENGISAECLNSSVIAEDHLLDPDNESALDMECDLARNAPNSALYEGCGKGADIKQRGYSYATTGLGLKACFRKLSSSQRVAKTGDDICCSGLCSPSAGNDRVSTSTIPHTSDFDIMRIDGSLVKPSRNTVSPGFDLDQEASDEKCFKNRQAVAIPHKVTVSASETESSKVCPAQFLQSLSDCDSLLWTVSLKPEILRTTQQIGTFGRRCLFSRLQLPMLSRRVRNNILLCRCHVFVSAGISSCNSFRCRLCRRKYMSLSALLFHSTTHVHLSAKPLHASTKKNRKSDPARAGFKRIQSTNLPMDQSTNLDIFHNGCFWRFRLNSAAPLFPRSSKITTGSIPPYLESAAQKRIIAAHNSGPLERQGNALLSSICVGSNPRLYACHECPASFAWKTALTSHMINHLRERIFQCRECGRRFASSQRLAVHEFHCLLLARHQPAKPLSIHVCLACGRVAKTAESLRSHVKYAHGHHEYDNI